MQIQDVTCEQGDENEQEVSSSSLFTTYNSEWIDAPKLRTKMRSLPGKLPSSSDRRCVEDEQSQTGENECLQVVLKKKAGISTVVKASQTYKKARILGEMFASFIEVLCEPIPLSRRENVKSALINTLVRNGIVPPKFLSDDSSPLRESFTKLLSSALRGSGAQVSSPTLEYSYFSNKSSIVPAKSRYETDFEEIEEIGRGGFGTVYKVRAKLDRRFYAVKKIQLKKIMDVTNKVLNEIQLLALLNHPNIIRYHSGWIEIAPVNASVSPTTDEIRSNIAETGRITPFLNVLNPPSVEIIRDNPNGRMKIEEVHSDVECGSPLKSSHLPLDGKLNGSTHQLTVEGKSDNSFNPSSVSSASSLRKKPRSIGSRFWARKSEDTTNSENESETTTTTTSDDEERDGREKIEDNCSLEESMDSIFERSKSKRRDNLRDLEDIKDLKNPKDDQNVDLMSDSVTPILEEPNIMNTLQLATRTVRTRTKNSRPLEIVSKLRLSNSSSNISPPPAKPIMYIQMELCSLTLEQYLVRRNKELNILGNNSVDGNFNRKLTEQLLSAIEYIHSRNLIHRDIKPGNVFIKRTGEKLHFLLGDFGLATLDFNLVKSKGKKAEYDINVRVPARIDMIHSIGVGTSTYAAPEQLKSSIYDTSVDIYSAGIVLYEVYNVFTTGMERHGELEKFKKQQVTKSCETQWPSVVKMLLRMTHANSELRPSASQLLQEFMHKESEVVSALREIIKNQEAEIAKLKQNLRHCLIDKQFGSRSGHFSWN